MERGGEIQPWTARRGERKEHVRRERKRKSIVIFSFSAAFTATTAPLHQRRSPKPLLSALLSSIIIGGCLIILKTADYQSGSFQGPTSKQSQQYRTEREFLWTVWAPADWKKKKKKALALQGTLPTTTTTKPPTHLLSVSTATTHLKCCHAAARCGYEWRGGSRSGMHTRKV